MDRQICLLKSDFEIFHDDFQELKSYQKANDLEKSKSIIDQMIQRLENFKKSKSEESGPANDSLFLRLLAMKNTLLYERSKILVNLGEDSVAMEILEYALELIRDSITKLEIIYLALKIINHYAYLLIKKEDFKKAREVLELSEKTYEDLKKENELIPFYTSEDLFLPESGVIPNPTENSTKLERLVTNNLQMLAFVYNKQELHDGFADYHHKILQRHLDMKDEDFGLWALRSARLALYFVGENRFEEARHHLTAAIYILHKYKKELKALEPSDDVNSKLEDVHFKFADVAKFWVKYGLSLFNVSKTNSVSKFCGEPTQALEKLWISPICSSNDEKQTSIMSQNIDRIEDCAEKKNISNPRNFGDSKTAKETKTGSSLFFKSIDLSAYEKQVSANLIENTNQARELFNYTHSWLKRAKIFYTLQDHPMEYVNAVLDLSELYRYLAFYEEDIESQYAVQKLRASALETLSAVLKEIHPECYIVVSVELLRELAEVQLEMMGLNLRQICMAQEFSSQTGDLTLQKMEALGDIHSKLEQFGDSLGHNIDFIDNANLLSSEMDEVCPFVENN